MENENSKIDLTNQIREILIAEDRPVNKRGVENQLNAQEYDYDSNEIVTIRCVYIEEKYVENAYPEYDEFLYLKSKITDFWLKEIETILDETKEEMSLINLKKQLSISFLNYFALYPYPNILSELNAIDLFDTVNPRQVEYQASDVGIEVGYKNLLDLLRERKDKFYLKEDSVYSENEQIKVGLKKWLEEGRTMEPKEFIKNEIINSVFKKSVMGTFTLDQVVFRVNRLPIKAGIPKPFSDKLIEEIILEDSYRFKYDKNANTVTIIDDLNYYTTIINTEQYLLKEFNSGIEASGFVAFTFVGKEFPLKEAVEYVSTRPIIYISSVDNLSKEFDSIINKEAPQSSELMIYLEAILPPNINPTKWLEDNVTITFAKSDSDTIKKISNQLISKLSPVFNLKNNPGNLFQYTLKSKLDERNKRVHKIQ